MCFTTKQNTQIITKRTQKMREFVMKQVAQFKKFVDNRMGKQQIKEWHNIKSVASVIEQSSQNS